MSMSMSMGMSMGMGMCMCMCMCIHMAWTWTWRCVSLSTFPSPDPGPNPYQVLGSGDAQFVRLADFRSGRGEARRVVLVVAEEAALRTSMAEAASAASQIASAEFLVVPVRSLCSA